MAREIDLDDDANWFGRGNAKSIDRILKRALAKEKDRAMRGAGSAARTNVARNTELAARRAYRHALKKAIVRSASKPRKSSRLDLGTGRSFYLNVEPLKPNANGSSNFGKAAASSAYIDREDAVEKAEINLDEYLDRNRDENLDREMGIDLSGKYQGYIERTEAVEKTEMAFSFGTIGETPEERTDFWNQVQTHFPARNRHQYKMILALPHEAPPEVRLRIMADFTDEMFRKRNIPFWCALHAPTGKNDPRNFHAHIVYIGRPANVMVHAEKVLKTRKGKIVEEGEKRLVWDFAAPIIDNSQGRHKVRYPYRQRDDLQLRREHASMTPIRSRFARIVNFHMKLNKVPVVYDPFGRRMDQHGIQPMKELDRAAIEILEGKRPFEKDPFAFQAIFANEIIRTKRLEAEAEAQIKKDELALAELERKQSRDPKKEYAYAGSLWQADERHVDRIRTSILKSRIATRRNNLATYKPLHMEITLIKAVRTALKDSTDNEERRLLKNLEQTLLEKTGPALEADGKRFDAHARVMLNALSDFRNVGCVKYDPVLDLAMRKVAAERNIEIPDRLREVQPSNVILHPEAFTLGIGERKRLTRAPFDIRAETLPEIVGTSPKLNNPASLEELQRFRADADEEIDKKEKARRKRAERRKALLSQKPRKGKNR